MKGKFIKKLTAYALTAAMILSTPMTAFASEFADNFWYSDGDNDYKDEGGPSGTGTVTVTNTTDLSQYDIGRIAIDRASVVLDSGKQENLTVEVYNTSGAKITDDAALKDIYSQIEWRTSNYSIVRPKVENSKGRQNCTITGYKGGFANITAGINVTPNRTGKTDTTEKEYSYIATCRVMVRKTPSEIYLDLPNDNTLYAGHTYDLTDYVSFNEGAFDGVDFNVEVKAANAKKAALVSWGKNGVLMVDKKVKDADNITLTVTATCQSANSVTKKVENVKVSEGVPATGLSFDASSKSKAKYDIKNEYDGKVKKTNYEYPAIKVTAKTKGSITTDDITWSTSDAKIVRILAKDDTTPMNEKTEKLTAKSNDREIRFQGMSVGKATITATSTSGKSAKLNVTVTASLIAIESAEISNNATYTGKATPIVVKRIPAQNQSKLKIDINTKTIKQIKGKAAITPILTPAADLSKIVGGTKVDDKTIKISGLKVMPATKKEVSADTTATIADFTITQSDVKLVDKAGVLSAKKENIIAKKKENINQNRTVTYFANLDPNHANDPGEEAVSWESSKETVAKITGQGMVQIVGTGSAKITVSSVYKDGAKCVSKKQSFTIQSTPKCEQIVFSKSLVTVKKGKDATIQIKEELPKKAADQVAWYLINDDGTLKELKAMGDLKTNKKYKLSSSELSSGAAKVLVRTSNGVEAMATVVVVP